MSCEREFPWSAEEAEENNPIQTQAELDEIENQDYIDEGDQIDDQ